MSEPEPVHIEPVPDDGVGAIMVGLVIWAAAGAVCLMLREQLAERGNEWWIWTCVAGLGLGLVGLAFVRRRSRVYRSHRTGEPVAGAGGSVGGSAAG